MSALAEQLITPRSDMLFAKPSNLKYELKPSLSFAWCPKSKDSDELCATPTRLKHLKLHNPPPELIELLEEVNHLTPKQTLFFDSRPLMGGSNPYAANWIDTSSCPFAFIVYLNPETATSEIVMHELGHAFVEHQLGIEDHREYFDKRDRAMHFLVSCIQSYVIDLLVLIVLQQRGVDCTRFYYDMMRSACEAIGPYADGYMHKSKYAKTLTAGILAVPSAKPDLYRLSKADREVVKSLWIGFRLHEPELARCADRVMQAIVDSSLDTTEECQRTIDQCLSASFEFLGIKFEPSKHLRQWEIACDDRDKMRDFMSGAPNDAKYQALKKAIELRRNIRDAGLQGNKIAVVYAPEGEPFSALKLPKITRPVPLHPAEYSHNPDEPWPSLDPALLSCRCRGAVLHKADPRINYYLPQYELTPITGGSQNVLCARTREIHVAGHG